MVEKTSREYVTLRDIKVKFTDNTRSVLVRNQDTVFQASLMIVEDMWEIYASKKKNSKISKTLSPY